MNYLKDETAIPTDKTVGKFLGEMYIYYEKLSNITKGYLKSWNFAKSTGWTLKIYDKKKALCYLTPIQNAYKIGLTVRETERSELLNNHTMSFLHDDLESAKKFSEGYALYFTVSDSEIAKQSNAVLENIIRLRNK